MGYSVDSLTGSFNILQDYDFFMGDVTLTYDTAKFVEFSFFTLVDSEAFVTHRPSKLNEAFALIRPFQWQVSFNFVIFLKCM